MPYKIKVWIPVEEDEPEMYKSRKEALKDLESLKLTQPENIYKIVKVSGDEAQEVGKCRREGEG